MITSKPSYYNSKIPGRTQAHVVVTSQQQQTNRQPERVETLPDLEVGEILGKKGGRISPVIGKLKPKASPTKGITGKAAKPNEGVKAKFNIVGTPKAICSPPN